MDEVSQWYNERAAKAKALAEELAQAKAEGKPKEVIEKLEWALELARYVGD